MSVKLTICAGERAELRTEQVWGQSQVHSLFHSLRVTPVGRQFDTHDETSGTEPTVLRAL